MKKTYSIEALKLIAKISNGGMRDAITSLDVCLSYSAELTIESVTEALGITGYDDMFKLINCLLANNASVAVMIIEKIDMSGKDLKLFAKQFLAFILDIVKYQFYQNFDYITIPQTYEKELITLKNEPIRNILEVVMLLQNKVKYEASVKVLLEAEFIVLCGEGV